MLYAICMRRHISPTPERLQCAIQEYFAERQAEILPSGEQTKDGRQFSWCGDVLEFLAEELAEHLAQQGITFSTPFPGPLRLMDEDRLENGNHVRRFWTMAIEHGCPIAWLCTSFFHRHDKVALPQLPQIAAYPPDHPGPEAEE